MKDTIKHVTAHTSQAFLALLLDFLKAIGKEERKEFFHDNRENMDTLAWYYWDEFKKEFYKKQAEKIEGYRTGVCEKTGTKCGKGKGEWGLYSYGRVLYIYIKEDKPRIGIECVFEDETSDNPLGKFHIYVATWDEPDFGTCKLDIDKYFPNKKERDERREFRLVAAFAHDDENAIISTLENTYNKLKEIIEEHNK